MGLLQDGIDAGTVLSNGRRFSQRVKIWPGSAIRVSEQAGSDITQLLIQATRGNREAVDALLPLVYGELRRVAGGYLSRERKEHTLQPTALVHEVYLRVIDQSRVEWQNRAHFMGVAATLMRRILVDHARSHGTEKRGRDVDRVPIDEGLVASSARSSEVLAVDEALKALAELDPVKSRVVELRFFGGLSIEETATVMGSSVATVNRQWRTARAWLYGQIRGEA
ncbi:MAG: sigma-70 family RNA polymerase sigma factor [Acidobacteria bacterium]|nr:sigma-70 family RNA polymerase sigma factor [Acidobacteriota bacterium]